MIFRSLRGRLFLLFLLVVVPVLLLIVIINIEQRQQAADNVRDNALRLIQLTTSQYEHLIKGTRQLLIALAQLPWVRNQDADACSSLFGDLFKRYPYYTTLGVANLEGYSFCSPLRATRPVNLADRAYIISAMQSRDFAIGDYAVGRRTGKASLHFGYPVFDQEGAVQGVVFAALDLKWLGELAAGLRLAPGTTFSIFDRNGVLLVRYPISPQWSVGSSAANSSVFGAAVALGGEGIVEAPDLSGVSSLFAFAPINDSANTGSATALYLAVGVPIDAAFAPVNYTFARNLIVVGVISLFAVLAAWWFGKRAILRPVSVLLDATEQLQSGNLAARTGMQPMRGELAQLGYAFDHMAEQLDRRERQLRRSLAEATELKNLLDSVFSSIVSGVITTDTQGTVTLNNAAALHILGYSDSDDLAGEHVADLRPPLGSLLLPHLYRVGHTGESVVGLETSVDMPPRGVAHLRFNLSTLKGQQETQGIAIVVDDVTEKRQVEAQRRLLEHMVSPAILTQLDPERLQLGGKRAEITALFADIHGFTQISEQLNPEDLVGLLNRYLAAMANAVLAEEGTIDKFLGDAVMAWFNAPLPQPDHIMRAIRAALGIRDAIAALHEEISPLFRLSFGVGLHVGEAVLGLVGTQERMEYTAIGDDINIAKRIQEHTGISQILISAAVYERVKEQVLVTPVTTIQAKGKQKPLEVYELLDLK
ncbi:adenylate/guanylate cyclase domain-containing protein [Marinobacterium aestuariivivens]|uniref:Adenylate/guanylate cyclase domain-containing protein n=1 Tax=Marinobacterium aestuariivivens TaxID=1698799 RepID=A0ABW2A5K7_9GAMM